MERRLQEFDRIGALANWLEETPNNHHRPSSIHNSASFNGTKSFAEAMELLRIGWPAGVVEMKNMIENIERVLLDKIPRPQIKRDLSGSDVDIGAYLSGEPENMLEWEAQPISEEGVRVIVNGAASAGVKTRTIKARGAVAVATIHALQMLEIPVELWGVWACSANRASIETRVRLSRPGHELDIERIAFCLAHPSMFRRIVFGAWEREEPKNFRALMGIEPPNGYGWPQESTMADEKDIYLGRMLIHERGTNWNDTNAAVEWILDKLRGYGVELEAA